MCKIRIALLLSLCIIHFPGCHYGYILAQVIPDLTQGDHFLPGLSEFQKQNLILKPNQGTHQSQNAVRVADLPVPAAGTPYVNPYTDYYVKMGIWPSASYNPNLSVQQRNQAMMDEQMKNSERQKDALAETDKIFNELNPPISYDLGVRSGKDEAVFVYVYKEIEKMLSGSEPLDFLKAVWLVEAATDRALSWDEFRDRFAFGAEIITAIMRKDKLSPNDNLAKIMSIYKYMADSTKVYLAAREMNVTCKPMLYDFEDYAAKKDPTKIFVSKLLRTGTGQCMSLPMLFYLYAKAFKADANLALAPEHSYITFKDNLGNRQNIELTGRMFTTTDFYWQTGFIKSEQTKTGIYLTPLTEKETLAELLTTLAKLYVHKFGADGHLIEMASTAKKYHPNSLSANMLIVGYTSELWKHVLRQYAVHRLSDDKLLNDERAQAIRQDKEAAYNHLMKDLGYAKIPDWAYQAWLKSINDLAIKRQHLVRKRQLEHQLNK